MVQVFSVQQFPSNHGRAASASVAGRANAEALTSNLPAGPSFPQTRGRDQAPDWGTRMHVGRNGYKAVEMKKPWERRRLQAEEQGAVWVL